MILWVNICPPICGPQTPAWTSLITRSIEVRSRHSSNIPSANRLYNVSPQITNRVVLLQIHTSRNYARMFTLCTHQITSTMAASYLFKIQGFWKVSKLLPQSTPKRVVARNKTWLICQQVWVIKAKIEGNFKGLTLMQSC